MDRLKQLEKKLAKVSPLGLVGTNPATYTPKNVMKQSVRFERKVVPIISTVVRKATPIVRRVERGIKRFFSFH